MPKHEPKSRASKATAANAARTQLPEWVTRTPDPMGYGLFMTTPNTHTEGQDIELSREEFVALKKELAKMRGYAVAEVARA